jgi:hypothetical protein
MISLSTRASLEAALTLDLEPKLQHLLVDRIKDTASLDLLDLTHIVVVEPGESEEDLQEEISLSPTINPIDGERYPSAQFQVWWDWLERHDGYWEMIITVADTGFAYLLFVPDADNTDPKLRDLCRTYAEPAGAVS